MQALEDREALHRKLKANTVMNQKLIEQNRRGKASPEERGIVRCGCHPLRPLFLSLSSLRLPTPYSSDSPTHTPCSTPALTSSGPSLPASTALAPSRCGGLGRLRTRLRPSCPSSLVAPSHPTPLPQPTSTHHRGCPRLFTSTSSHRPPRAMSSAPPRSVSSRAECNPDGGNVIGKRGATVASSNLAHSLVLHETPRLFRTQVAWHGAWRRLHRVHAAGA